ncbi:MAG TPA: hypothetical protein PLY52_11930 [Methanothrix sp.]|nr:hypothetical protein [Methanothrix sp.]
MTDADFLAPTVNQCILTSHIEALSRASRETGIINGNRLTASTPADMVVTIGAGRIKIAGTPADVAEDTVTLDAAHTTLPRIDIIYRDVTGDAKAAKGTPATIEDPKGLSDWKSYTSPLPPSSIPPGAIIGAVWIPAECTAITSEYIWMFAGGVGDLATSIGTPGTDAMPASEKAVRDVLAECAPASNGVTNGDSHDHSGGDGAQIDHGSLAGRTDDDHSIYYNQARGDARYAQLAHASRHTSGGADAIKIDDLAAGDDNTDLNASTAKHGLMMKYPNTAQVLKGDGSWLTRNFEIDFPFGDGENVIEAGAAEVGVPIASKITRVDIWEVGLVSSSITCTLYKHAIGAAKGSAVDTFAISSDTDMTETGLNISVSQHEILRIEVSGITAAKQIVCRLFLEGT